jgi:type III pantothenate kinase
MLLAIDIGNTNIACGLFKKDRIIKRFSFPTKPGQYYYFLKRELKKNIPDSAIIASVVPKATSRLELALRFLRVGQLIVLGENITVPIKNRYRYPKQVGQDRLVNGFAAVKLYGTPAIVVDFGTAITFDVISKKKEYMGGMILPGLGISLDSLNQRTALLPRIKLYAPSEFIGRDTKNSILSGIVYGFAGLTDTLIERIKNKLGKNVLVIGTGGDIGFIGRYCKKIDKIDKDLTLKGLNLIYLGAMQARKVLR